MLGTKLTTTATRQDDVDPPIDWTKYNLTPRECMELDLPTYLATPETSTTRMATQSPVSAPCRGLGFHNLGLAGSGQMVSDVG
jgi:hypothetical protein